MSSAFAALRSATRAHSSRLAAHRSTNASRTLARAYSSSTQDGSGKQDGAQQQQQEADASSQPQQANANAKSKADDPCADVSAKLKAKEAEVVDVTGRLRYLQADFLNLQRNAAREKEQTRDFAISRFAGDLLETVDVLALALKSVPAEYTAAASSSASTSSSSSSSSTTTPSTETAKEPADHLRELYNGVELTHRLLLQTLFKYHVKPFDPTGDRFDPNRHEALYQAPVPGKESGSVIDCQKVGFMIKDRVLRAAQVGVAQEVQS